MENSALNKAHEAGREAVRLQRKGRYGQAAECHLRAANLLLEVQQKVSQDSVVASSLEEQGKYHRRQAELAQVLREISEKQKSSIGSSSMKMADSTPKPDAGQTERSRRFSNNAFQSPIPLNEIRKNFDEADSLLQILWTRNGPNPQFTTDQQGIDVQGAKALGFTRRPKNDAEVIEELQIVNTNLRSHVDRLLKELQDAKEENNLLRTRLEMYEKSSSTKSSASTTSILSAALEHLPPRELPELAPLESPDFDFNA